MLCSASREYLPLHLMRVKGSFLEVLFYIYKLCPLVTIQPNVFNIHYANLLSTFDECFVYVLGEIQLILCCVGEFFSLPHNWCPAYLYDLKF